MAGTAVWSLKEPWTETADPRMAELPAALYAWMAAEESRRRSERTRAGLGRRKREGLPVGRQPPLGRYCSLLVHFPRLIVAQRPD